MFGRQGGLAGNSGGSGSNLVEFRAGKMNMVGKMVHPDKRKGLVYITQSEDGLMHFCWKDRTSGKVEDDLIIFPDDFEFKRVTQCKTGRVFVLKCKTSTRRMFFWLQEPKEEKDEEYCRRVNELMNNPPSQQRGGNADGGDIQYVLNNMSQQQLMQLFGGVGQMGGLSSLLGSMNRSNDGSRTPGSNRSTTAVTTQNLVTPENNPSAVPKTPSAPKRSSNKDSTATTENTEEGETIVSGGTVDRSNIDLAGAIAASEEVEDIIGHSDNANQLSVHLPESAETDEEKKQQIKDTIASPQFQQALTLFSNALQSAQLGPVVSQFELPADAVAAAYAGNVEDFVKALEHALPAGASMSPTHEAGRADGGGEKKNEEKSDNNSPTEKKE